MQTCHPADGPGSVPLSGPGDHTALAANDNPPRHLEKTDGLHGLALVTDIDLDGAPVATIRGVGPGGYLLPPLHLACDPFDIIALWRGLGRDLDLPLYLRDEHGVMTPVTPTVGGQVFPHHRGSPLSGRRPRFLARRQSPLGRFDVASDATSEAERRQIEG